MSTSIPYDPEKAALLVIDMQTQHGYMNSEFDGGALAQWWKDKDKMIMRGSEKWKILNELDSIVTRSLVSIGTLDFIIQSKIRYNAFYKTELNSFLNFLGIKTLIISGVKTNLCCETTARKAFDKNYDIVFIEDATATDTQEMHEATLLNIGYGFGIVTTVKNTIEWLLR
ncbi:isochorismatase hydrolase [Gigaspora margarita]|uniref:Isochorismatase hydrolase n=1 Tax=Gigaspora margarita TaxID=4874 RepID=A0A8H3XGP7_GIGMA|nr:isochorismatase hydrolase [Gigaspora margarita]